MAGKTVYSPMSAKDEKKQSGQGQMYTSPRDAGTQMTEMQGQQLQVSGGGATHSL